MATPDPRPGSPGPREPPAAPGTAASSGLPKTPTPPAWIPLALVAVGVAYGLAVALVVGGGQPVLVFAGFISLPLAWAAGMMAWRVVLAAWLAREVAGSAVRSRGRGSRMRADLSGRIGEIRAAGLGRLPGTWVFLPAALLVGLVAGLVALVAGGAAGALSGLLLLAGCVAMGLGLRRLARAGRLPLGDE